MRADGQTKGRHGVVVDLYKYIYGIKRFASDGPNPHPYPSFRMVGWVHSKKMKDQIIHHEKTSSGGRATMSVLLLLLAFLVT